MGLGKEMPGQGRCVAGENIVELKNKVSFVINLFQGMHRNGKHMPSVKKNTAL